MVRINHVQTTNIDGKEIHIMTPWLSNMALAQYQRYVDESNTRGYVSKYIKLICKHKTMMCKKCMDIIYMKEPIMRGRLSRARRAFYHYDCYKRLFHED